MKTVAAPLLVHNLNIWVEFVLSYVDCRCPFELNFRTYYTIRSGLPPYISLKTIEENSRRFSVQFYTARSFNFFNAKNE